MAIKQRLTSFLLVTALAASLSPILGVLPAAASPYSVADVTAGVDGTVRAVLQVGDRTFIGGDFTAVGGQPRNNAAAIRADGTVDPLWQPSPDGVVRALAANADGSRIFLGGSFRNAGGAARSGLAAVDSSAGVAIADWVADVDAEGAVRALATSDSRLYVGGTFTVIKGLALKRLAAVDMATAAVISTFKPRSDWAVNGLAVSPDGTRLYAGGGFGAIGGAPRPGAAELDASTGQATAFAPTDGGVVLAVALTPDGSRFFFSTTSNRLQAYDPAASNSPAYTVQTSGDTQAIAASATEVYFGGHFSRLTTYKVKRLHLASVYVADGRPTAWNPRVDGSMGVWGATVTPSSVVVGGDFLHVGTAAQPGFARFSGTP
ncbi:hypothetical protein BH20ACT9_BH20ACT9_17340 [soil metagenome]